MLDQLFILLRICHGDLGVCPISLHVFCGQREIIWLQPSGDLVEGASGVWGSWPVAIAIWFTNNHNESLGLVASGCWTLPGKPFITDSVYTFWGKKWAKWQMALVAQYHVSAFCRGWDSSESCLQLALEWFAANCKAAWMRFSASKSETMEWEN